MKSIKVTIKDQVGLHARPASELVQIASKFSSEINLVKDGKAVNAKSIINIMSLGVKFNDNIEINANGSDEGEALQAIENKLKESKVI